MKLSLKSLVLWALFLVPALLLTTPNGSVAVIGLMSLYSIYFIFKNRRIFLLNRFDKLIIASLSSYFIIYIPTTIADGTTLRYFQGGLRLLLCIPIYFLLIIVLKEIRTEQIKKALIWGVCIGSFGAAIFACYQIFVLGMPRVDGFLYSINFGYLSTALLCLSASFLLSSPKLRILLTLSTLAALFATVFTLTRGAMFAVPLLLIFGLTLSIKQFNWKTTVAIALSLAVLSVATYHFSTAVQQRIDFTVQEFSSIEIGNIKEATSSGTRLFLWKAAIEAYKESPLIGLPYREREKLNQELYKEGKVNDYVKQLPRGHAHNQYFEMLASTGSLSFIGIFMMLIFPLFVFVKHFWQTQSCWGFIGAIFVAGFIIFGLTEVPLQANAISAFYGFMLATFFALVRNEKYNYRNKKCD